MAQDDRAQKRLKNIEAQITACERGEATVITCPYCSADNEVGNEVLCCELLGAAVEAILDGKEVFERVDQAHRVADKFSRLVQ